MKNIKPFPVAIKVVPVRVAKYSCLKCPAYCCTYENIGVGKRDVKRLAKHFGLAHAFVAGIGGSLTWRSDWALLARDPARLAIPEIKDAASFELSAAPVAVWTDDYSNLLSLLRW